MCSRAKAKIKAGEVYNDLFHMAKGMVELFDGYGDKVPQPWRVYTETAELFQVQQAEEGLPWHLKLFTPGTDADALGVTEVARLAAAELGLRDRQVRSRLRELGFLLEAKTADGRRRIAKLRFPGANVAVPVKKA